MKKVLLYVDAENVSIDDVNQKVEELKNSLASDEQLVGKFYGGVNVIGGLMSTCYQLGLEYTETSSLNRGVKNLTDMKIIVDCIFDVSTTYYGEISRVCILSNDCDFTPLVLKLRSQNFAVEAPLFNFDNRERTCQDVSKKLIEQEYYPLDNSDPLKCFNNQYGPLRSVLSDDFSDDVILRYLDKKRSNFLKAAKEVCGISVLKLNDVPSDEFCFDSVLDAVSLDDNSLRILIRQYTSKFFGGLFPDTVTDKLVRHFSLRDVKIP
jgi:hypothetical protein